MKTTTVTRIWTKTFSFATVLAAAALTASNASAHGGGGGGGGGGGHSGSSSHSMSHSSPTGSFKQSNFKSNSINSNNFNSKKILTNSGGTFNKPISGINTNNGLPKHGTTIGTTTGNNTPINGKNGTTIGKLPVGPGSVNLSGSGKGTIGNSGNNSGKRHNSGSGNSSHHNHCWNNFIFWGLLYPNYGFSPYYNGTTRYNTTYYSNGFVTPVSAATPGTVVDGIDLQLVDVRLLDNGRPDEQIGPRYRISFRNAGSTPVETAFNVSLAATTEFKVSDSMPETTTRVTGVNGNEVKFVDMRLPPSVFEMTTATGAKTEFSKLLVFVDSGQEVKDTNRENNMAGLERTAIKTAE